LINGRDKGRGQRLRGIRERKNNRRTWGCECDRWRGEGEEFRAAIASCAEVTGGTVIEVGKTASRRKFQDVADNSGTRATDLGEKEIAITIKA
jgi:hypothetical protein